MNRSGFVIADLKVKDPTCRNECSESLPCVVLGDVFGCHPAASVDSNWYGMGMTGPEFYFLHQGRKVWVEAVAPRPGEKEEDRVPGYRNGELAHIPEEKILLRFTNALAEKRKKYKEALEKNIIAPDDLYILAINSRGIPDGWDGDILPYFVKAFLPLGTPDVAMDITTGEILELSISAGKMLRKQAGQPVSTTAVPGPSVLIYFRGPAFWSRLLSIVPVSLGKTSVSCITPLPHLRTALTPRFSLGANKFSIKTTKLNERNQKRISRDKEIRWQQSV